MQFFAFFIYNLIFFRKHESFDDDDDDDDDNNSPLLTRYFKRPKADNESSTK
jgi:hypothetical protein